MVLCVPGHPDRLSCRNGLKARSPEGTNPRRSKSHANTRQTVTCTLRISERLTLCLPECYRYVCGRKLGVVQSGRECASSPLQLKEAR